MTTIDNTNSNNEYWKQISSNPSAYFDEFSMNLVNDILATDNDCFDSFHTIIEEENDELSPSPSSSEVKNSK